MTLGRDAGGLDRQGQVVELVVDGLVVLQVGAVVR